MSILEMYLALNNWANVLVIKGRGYGSFIVPYLSFCYSMHGLNKPSFFLMNNIGKVVREDEGHINPFSRLLSNYSF
jgi:hypothetical protein